MAMFIAVAVIMAAYSVYLVSTRSYNRGEKITDITQNGRIAMDRITREIRQTNAIVPQIGPSPTYTLIPFSSSSASPSNLIEFQDGHVTEPINDVQYIKYFLDGNQLRKQRLVYVCSLTDSNSPHVNKLIDCSTNPGIQYPSSKIYNEDNVVAEKITNLKLWGESEQRLINISFDVTDGSETVNFTTKVFGRNIP